MKDFEKTMQELRESLSGLDDKIAKKVNAAFEEMGKTFKKYKVFYDHENGVSDDADTVIIHTPSEKARQKTDKNADEFVKMAPYLDDDSLHELVVEFCDGDLETDMKEILPFLDEDDVGIIMKKFSGGVDEFKGLRPEDLYPFAPEESIDEVFTEKFLRGELDEDMISFVSDEGWHKLVVRYCEDENSTINIDELYPFLDDEDLNLLFRTYLKRRKKK